MIIKLLKIVKELPINSIVDTDELTAKDLIEKQEAIEFTNELEQLEKVATIKEIKEIKMSDIKDMEKKEIKEEIKEVQHKIGTYSAFIAKSSGMNETTAADGGALTYTAVSELLGLAMEGSVLYNKTNKLTLPVRSNAMKVRIDASDPWIASNAPVVATTAEGVSKTDAKMAFGNVTLTPQKQTLYIPCTDELLEDVPELEGVITSYSKGKMALRGDDLLLNGDATSTGCYGVLTANCSSYVVTVSVSATPTVANLVKMVDAIANPFQDSAEWYMPRTVWELICGAHGTAANVQLQLIDISGKKILGKNVNIMHTMAASTLAILSPRAITVVEPRINDVAKTSYDILFKTDETVFRLVKRISSHPNYTKRTCSDGSEIAGIAMASFASA